SRIQDVDVAQETSNLSRAQILMQAGVSVLAQANQIPQVALKLLG
ncbi:MAG TPA: flagellin, partial [Polyangia bacterium]|nr:flagellin [Polyangia bacterium]HEX3698648.1 flagellin [Polyangia bacterium]